MPIQKTTDFLTLVQSADTIYQGNESDQVYSLIPGFLESGETITIIDQGGSNSIELAEGLTIISSTLVYNEALLYLNNGSIVNIRGADNFTFSISANSAAGVSGINKNFSTFSTDVLGQSLPAEGESAVTSEIHSVIRSGGEVDTLEVKYLTVTEEQLRAAVSDGSYAIEEDDITYTFGDSEYNIDTSQVKDMSYLFYGKNDFNEDIGYWDTSNVINMSGMFKNDWDYIYYADGIRSGELSFSSSFNQDIGEWDVSSVTDMSMMFEGAGIFNHNIGQWDVSNVITMFNMFTCAGSFDSDIGAWDVSNVTDMSTMFFGTLNFNQNISNWNTSNITNMESMFLGSAFNQDIGKWDASNVTNMDRMFLDALNFNQDLSGWNVKKITEEPADFAFSSGISDKLEFHPNWGQAPEEMITGTSYNYEITVV